MPKYSELLNRIITSDEPYVEFIEILGTLEGPDQKREFYNLIVLFGQILPHAAPELQSQLLELKNRLEKTKYSNSINYSQHAELIFHLMGDVRCLVYIIVEPY